MAADFVIYSGKSNVGFKMKANEDWILIDDTNFGDDILYASIADGVGSKGSTFRPAAIASNEAREFLSRFYKKDQPLFMNRARLLLEQSMRTANDVLIAFKLGNEEERYGYATTLSSVLVTRNGILYFAHTGNTRIYLVRDGKTFQLTKDMTEGQKLVDAGKISEDEYYVSAEKLSLYSGIGIEPEPQIQTAKFKLLTNDVIVMTTDGIHYSYKSEAFFDILSSTPTMDDAAETMIDEAMKLKNYADNLSVNLLWYTGPGYREGSK